jgi:hypothetical protein
MSSGRDDSGKGTAVNIDWVTHRKEVAYYGIQLYSIRNATDKSFCSATKLT